MAEGARPSGESGGDELRRRTRSILCESWDESVIDLGGRGSVEGHGV